MAELDSFPNQQPQDSDEVVAAHDSNGDGTLDDTVNWTWSEMKAALDSAGYARLGKNETFTNGLNVTGGNVGIGTASPLEKLEVNGSIFAKGEQQIIGIDAADQVRLGFIKQFGFGPKIGAEKGSDITLGHLDTTNLRSFTDSTNWNPRLTIDTNGNVGIGTTSPDYTLDTAGAIRAQDKLLTDFSDPTVFSAREVKSGTSAPSDSEGKNGDIYIQTN